MRISDELDRSGRNLPTDSLTDCEPSTFHGRVRADVPTGQLAQAVERIRDRRAACHDSALEMLPDDPFGVVQHVITHRRVPAAILRADLEDALIIARCLHEARDRQDLSLLRAAAAAGVSGGRIAAIWGFRGRQGTQELRRRLEAATRGGRRDARLPRWLARNQAKIRGCADMVSANLRSLPPDAALSDALDDVIEALTDNGTPEVLLATLRLAASAHDRTPPHEHGGACQALADGAALADRWDELSGNSDY